MAQPARIGLSNPYDGGATAVDARPGRARPVLARAAVLAGVSGAAAVGLGGTSSAWADTATAVPVSRWDGTDMSCLPLHQPVLHGATTQAGVRPGQVARWTGTYQAWPLRCGSPPWSKPMPVDPLPWTPEPPDPAVGDPLDGPQLVSVAGTVEDGVEPGCVVLSDADGAQWTLTGPLRTLPHGVPLTIKGTVTPGLLTTCQQGEPIRVRQVELADGTDVPAGPVPIATTDRLAAEARPIPVTRRFPVVTPACGPISEGKIPSVALCTR